jgi:hypothetical protein
MKARKLRKRIPFNPPKGYFLIENGSLRKKDLFFYKPKEYKYFTYTLYKGATIINKKVDSKFFCARPKNLRGLYSNFLDWCEKTHNKFVDFLVNRPIFDP